MMAFDKMEVSSSNLVDGPPPGFVLLKKSRVLFVVVVVAVTIVVVGLLAGLLAAKHERKLADEKYEKLSGGTQKKTSLPSTTKSSKQTTLTKPTTAKPTTTATTAKPSTTAKPATTATAKSSTTASTPCVGLWCSVRLPTDVIPYHYDLTIRAYVANLTFTGSQIAHVVINNATKYILIHINKMEVTHAMIQKDNWTFVPVAQTFEYKENQFFVIEAQFPMNPGKYLITLLYRANVSTVLTGFYKSTYKTSTGVTRTLLTTKFQPTDARKAFPCFDEPDLKATFNVTIIHPPGYKVLSNMPVVSNQSLHGNSSWIVTKFGKTVKMSAYLIAFIVCDFDYKESMTGLNNDITMRVYSSPPQIANVDYALKRGAEMLTFLEDFFKVRYVLPKLDMVAIPDYGSGATEHWGVITYRQARLLYSKNVSSESNKQSIGTIIAHELAHLWFGNLVTCKWWNDLWVQEGMSSYIEYYALNNSHPDWKMFDQFLVSDLKRGLDLDALASSHPIVMPVSHPKQIKEIFDSITYSKGSSIFRMLDDFLGQETFRDGLAQYLTKHKFQGATSSDLWTAFSEVSKKDIKAMMETWTLQMGFPLITIKRISNTSTQATVTQKHYLLDPKANVTTTSPYNYKWIVPFTYITGNAPNMRNQKIMNKTSAEIVWPLNTWIKGNYMQKGFYRCTYDNENWNQLIHLLNTNHKIFSASDRVGLIDDAFSLARAGILDYKVALGTTKYLDKEEEYVVWRIALSNLGYLNRVLSARPSYETFKKYMVQKLRPMVSKLGWEMTGSHIDKFKRIMFLSAACKYGDDMAIANATILFKKWKDDNIPVNPELKSLVYDYGIANGGAKEWDYVYKQFQNASNPTEKSKLQGALSSTEKPSILRKWLRFSMDPSKVRSQDTVYVITAVSIYNPVGRYVAWNFARANWPALMDIMKANNFHVTRMTSGITYQFNTEFELQEVTEFWKKYPNAGAGARARIQGKERIQASIDWVKNYATSVEDWLNSEVQS